MDLIIKICDELEREQKDNLDIVKVKEKILHHIQDDSSLLQLKAELNVHKRYDEEMDVFYTKIIALLSFIISLLLGLHQVINTTFVKIVDILFSTIAVLTIITIVILLVTKCITIHYYKIGNRTKWLKILEVVLDDIEK